MQIVKRSGNTQELNIDKVKRAILMAFSASNEKIPNVTPIAHSVFDKLTQTLSDGPVSVNQIQDCIENTLIEFGWVEVAKKFIAYRANRDRARDERLSPPVDAVPNYITAAKYAKWKEDFSRRETRLETINRSEGMHIDKFPTLKEIIKNSFEYVKDGKVMPSMRSMQFSGDAILQKNARIYNCSFTLIDRIEAFHHAFYLLLCGCGVGYSVQQQHVAKLPKVKTIGRKVKHHVVQDSIEGWCDALFDLVKCFYETGEHFEPAFHLVRDEGDRLKTSGGRAPGHLDLKEMFENVRAVFKGAQGRKLRPIEVHDIMCHIAVAVLAGGIRRSSLLCLFTHTDTEMLHCKTKGQFEPGKLNDQRQMANNAAALLRSTAVKEDLLGLLEIANSNYGCPSFFFTDNLDHGTNPCFAGDTWINTEHGLAQIKDLLGKKVKVAQQDGTFEEASAVEITGRNRQTYKVTFKSGRELVVTDNHEFPTINAGRVQTKELMPGDKIRTQFNRSNESPYSEKDYALGLTFGLWQGDGTSYKEESWVCLYGKDQKWKEYVKQQVELALNHSTNWFNSGGGGSKHLRLGGSYLHKLTQGEKRDIPSWIMSGNAGILAGYLTGMFFTDGSVQGSDEKSYSLRLSQSNKNLLQKIQIVLGTFGIQSKLRLAHAAGEKEMPGGIYNCEDNFELILGRQDMDLFFKEIGLFGPKAERYSRITTKAYKKDNHFDEVVSIEEDKVQDVYCLNVYRTHNLIANGLLVGNCGEIGLNPILENKTGFAFCNLTEVNGATAETVDDFYERIVAATIIGTLQASYTDFPYLGEVTEKIARRDALTGVSITGMYDNPGICLDADILKRGAELAVETNVKISESIGINPAKRITTIKPSGTASLALGCIGSGIHPSHAKRYFRRITANPNEPPAQYFKSINPHMVEQKANGDWSLIFPVEAEENALTLEDVTALELCEAVKVAYENWVLPGTAIEDDELTHNVSCTVHLRDGELPKVIDWIWENRDCVKAMSFVPYFLDKIFEFAPRRKCYPEDEAKWNNLIKNYTPVDWSKMIELEDGTTRQMSAACSGGTCEIT